jgi:hypothetical protein
MNEMSPADKGRRTQFLGREFLTWMLFRASRDGGVFQLGDEVVEVLFERVVALEGDNPSREASVIKVDDPTDSLAVKLALRLGKTVSKARIRLLAGGQEYSLGIDAAGLGLRTVRLPDAMAMDAVEALVERVGLARDLEDIVHQLFLQFMELRREPDAWSVEVAGLREWARAEPEA